MAHARDRRAGRVRRRRAVPRAGGIERAGAGRLAHDLGGICDLEQASTASDLMVLADGALYWAKAHGRNITFLYTPEVVEALSAEDRAERLERTRILTGLRALARAVDAKDPSTQRHSERVATLAGRHRRRARLDEQGHRRPPRRGPGARRRQDRHPRRDPAEARRADGGGVRDHQGSCRTWARRSPPRS